ncbi:MAG: low molecular weight phosphotyrosine protein phosphatase [Akkermansia sp.]|nr:low molecular weight phosphotyrosine protein phosphatase [Akkermansia sp.]
MSAPAPYRVLFVCLGNICRSPAAEIIFNAVAAKNGLAGLVKADSCGTASYHTGSKPDHRMLAALERAGYSYGGHRARTFRRADFSDFDLIIPQDEYNERDILALARNEADAAKVRGMWQWFGAEETESSVPDPYYGGPAGFDAVVALLTRSMEKLMESTKDEIRRTKC